MAALLALAALALAQAPPEISLTLSTPRASYRLGEPIPIALSFRSAEPGYYAVATNETTRYVRISEFDSLVVEPADGVRDPLFDIPAQREATARGAPALPQGLRKEPIVVTRYANELISFRRPGRYRITALSSRVPNVPLRSNTIEIEIIAPGQEWAARQLEGAVAVLEHGGSEEEVARAGRTVRFLETREAARALARFYEHGPQAAQRDLRAGLFGSPYRSDVMAAMERAIADPEVAISYYYIATLMELAMASRMGPSPLWPEQAQAHDEWLKRTRPISAEYTARFEGALESKRGAARAVSLETLERLRRELRYFATPARGR